MRPSALKAAPRTRRSTCRADEPLGHVRGCSAHAEIDPTPARRASTRARLLRARGDRPCSATGRRRSGSAAPRPRRSTRQGQGAPLRVVGCSAHAEIDPACSSPCACTCGLLRARGDRPYASQSRDPSFVAAPRTRRSTWPAPPTGSPIPGCSAHAEIDPCTSRAVETKSGLLRARGDRPYSDASASARKVAAPRTRRSTAVFSRLEDTSLGCSAHAEIDPALT